MAKILVKDKIFKLKVRYSIKKIEFVNLFIYRLTKIVVGSLLKKY